MGRPIEFTNEYLIEYVRKLRREFGRSPRPVDLNERAKQRKGPSSKPYRRFGSWVKVCRLAKIETIPKGSRDDKKRPRVTKAVIIAQLQRIAKWTDDTPKKSNLKKYKGKVYSESVYKAAWGKNWWSKALRDAGFRPNRKKWSKEELIQYLQNLASKLNKKTVTASDLYSEERKKFTVTPPSVPLFVRRFGSWNDALITAGLPENYGIWGGKFPILWQRLCYEIVKKLYKGDVKYDRVLPNGRRPDIYVTKKNLVVDAKTSNSKATVKKMKTQIKDYTINKKTKIEFWCLYLNPKEIIQKRGVKYVSSEQLVRKLEKYGFGELAEEVNKFRRQDDEILIKLERRTNKECEDYLRRFVKNQGCSPKQKEIDASGVIYAGTIVRILGKKYGVTTYNEVLKKLDLPIYDPKKYSDSELISRYRLFHKRYLRFPRRREILPKIGVSEWVYYKRFGSLRNVEKEALRSY